MKQRCTNPKHPQAKDYSERGITFCDEWVTFKGFLGDMGERPEGLSLERIDNEKGYSPSNCIWATSKEQNDNRRNNHLLTYDGKTQTVKDWSVQINVPYTTLLSRLNHLGWSVERALIKHD